MNFVLVVYLVVGTAVGLVEVPAVAIGLALLVGGTTVLGSVPALDSLPLVSVPPALPSTPVVLPLLVL